MLGMLQHERVTYDLSEPTGEFVLAPRGPVMVRILLADDHDIIRRGLRAVLQEQVGWEICGEALSARQTVDLVQALQPDIVIMDLMMSSPGGFETTMRQICKASRRT